MTCNISREGCQVELTIRIRLCSTNSRSEDDRYHVHVESQHGSAEEQSITARIPGQMVPRRNLSLVAHSDSSSVRPVSHRNLSGQARHPPYRSSALASTEQNRYNILSYSRRLSRNVLDSLDDILLPEIYTRLQQKYNHGVVPVFNAPSAWSETLPQRVSTAGRASIISHPPRPPRNAAMVAPPERRITTRSYIPVARTVPSMSTSISRIPIFRPYQPQISRYRSVPTALNRKTTQTLSSNDMTRGFIYVFWEPETSDHVKIGYTRNIQSHPYRVRARNARVRVTPSQHQNTNYLEHNILTTIAAINKALADLES